MWRGIGDIVACVAEEFRCMSTPAHVVVREFIFSIKTDERVYDRHSDGQCTSRPEPSVVVVIYPCIFEGDMGAGLGRFAEMRDETSLRQSLCDVVDELAGHINADSLAFLGL